MQKSDKDISPFVFELAYTQIKHSTPYIYLNTILIVLQYALFHCKLYFLIDPSLIQTLSLPYTAIFIALVSLLALLIILTIFTYHFQLFNSVWLYFLLFLQAIEMIFVDITMKCLTSQGWCAGEPKYVLSSALVLATFGVVIYIRKYCYCPFNDSSNPFSMNSGKTVVILFLYTVLICLATNKSINGNANASKQVAFILTLILYSLSLTPPYANCLLSRIFSICNLGLLWTSSLIWLTPIFQSLLNLEASNTIQFWYCWGYSFPIVICLIFFQTRHLSKLSQWEQLFLLKGNNDLRSLYLQTTSLIRFMDKVKRSDLKSNSAQFKHLWNLIKFHNNDCPDPECPLQILEGLSRQRGDELIQQKRFNKTIQKAIQFGLLKLVRQKDIYPNLIDLNMQIANYELQVFNMRTKGLQLYNREFYKDTISKQEMWGIFYLKRKIQGFQAVGEVRAKGQTEEDINSFKHDIEVSVSMLAQFWYFLADPKCNIKKLYDLANVLFPTKIRVDRTWKIVRQFKNIQCYNLYAKYLIKMFNDKQTGMRILEEAHRVQIQNNQKEQVLAGNQSNSNQQHGVIFLEFDGKNSGIMYQVNTACQIIFGYNKGELQGRKVNDIMPKVYSIHHDKILQNYQQTNRPKMMNKERQIWGKSKDGYLFPFTICIKPVRNYYSQTSQVYASVKRDLWVRESIFFFTDLDFNLVDISSSMLGLFPDLHGRLHLKKKVHIQQIFPYFAKIQDKVIVDRQPHELIIDRTFTVDKEQTYTQKIQFLLAAQEVTINVSGSIGYYFKLVKNLGSSSSGYSPNNNSSNFKENNADASNSYWMKRQNDFQFVVSVQEQQSESLKVKPLVYHGGIVKSNNQTLELINSRIQSSFDKTKSAMKQEHQQVARVQYGGDIKMKRLVGQAIREIHDLSQSSEQNNMAGNNNEDEQQNQQMVKPSELSSILSRQSGNRNINLLKLLTISILLLSTLLSIFEYISTYSNSNTAVSIINTVSAQNSLSSQIMYINSYSNLFKLGLMNNESVLMLRSQINELDSMMGSVPFDIASQITYSDGTNQSMILSFAIAKLISEAQLLTSSTAVPPNDPDLFFVHYNSVNGLSLGCEQAQRSSKQQLLSTNISALSTYWMYLAISVSVFSFVLILKNIVLRAVLKKKAQILNVFFQIPRYSCSSIQKQCQKFIQRLTADQGQQQFQMNIEQDQQQSSKKVGRQKKRTIMGEEKTGFNFIVVSLILLFFILIYPILVIIIAKMTYEDQQYSFNSATQIIRFQKEMAKFMSFVNTHNSQPNFTLSMQNASEAITSQYLLLSRLVTDIEERFYYLGNILSNQYINRYNDLFFKSLCMQGQNCSISYGQDKGLNTILFYYFDYAVQKYQLYTSQNASYIINAATIQKEQTLRLLIKQFWREFQMVLSNAISEFIRANDNVLFAFMLTVSILNMTALMWGWMRFYNSLGQKIRATEYILTFIPIDQINKNAKIAKYIKEQVLRSN